MTEIYHRLFHPEHNFSSLNDIEKLIPFMYLRQEPAPKVPQEPSPIPPQEPSPIPPQEPVPKVPQEPVPKVPQEPVPKVPQEPVPKSSPVYIPKKTDTLFWCIYIAIYGYTEYHQIGHRYGNIEIEEKQKLIELMRKNPTKIKECPKKITKVVAQEIMSDLMTNKKITTGILTAFAIYYNKRFWIVNQDNQTYMDIDGYKDPNEPDAGMRSMDADGSKVGWGARSGDREHHLSLDWLVPRQSNYGGRRPNTFDGFKDVTNDYVTVVYKKGNSYGLPQRCDCNCIEEIRRDMFCFDNFDTPLRAISNYKLCELEEIAKKVGVNAKQKKQELYQAILQKLIL